MVLMWCLSTASQYHGYIFFSAFIACLPVSLNLMYILYHDFPKKSSIELTDFPKILEVPSLTFYKYYIMNCGKSQILNLVRILKQRVGVEPTNIGFADQFPTDENPSHMPLSQSYVYIITRFSKKVKY